MPQTLKIPADYFPAAVIKATKNEIPEDFTFYIPCDDKFDKELIKGVYGALTPQEPAVHHQEERSQTVTGEIRAAVPSTIVTGEIKPNPSPPKTLTGKLTVKVGQAEATGRVLACRSHGGKLWSFTFRTESQGDNAGLSEKSRVGDIKDTKGYAPKKRKKVASKQELETPDKSQFLNSIDELCAALYGQLFARNRHGLLVITGETGVAKSQVLRGLIFKRLVDLSQDSEIKSGKKRRPHLVTFEDPIEARLFEENVKFTKSALLDFPSLARKVKPNGDSLSRYLHNKLTSANKLLLAAGLAASQFDEELIKKLIPDFNKLLEDSSLRKLEWFTLIKLRPETKQLLKQNLTDNELVRLNRLLLEDAYPEIAKYQPITEGLGSNKITRLLSHNYHIDYTPREKGRDVGCLKDALRDALRQTPAVFYVGETRDADEWVELLKFAGTGHLIVTTAHSGSLIETMQTIFTAAKAKTPAQRSIVADKILGVAHLKSNKVGNFDLALPALWQRTPAGVNALIADGLASLLPNASDDSEAGEYSFLGRSWFAKKLIAAAAETDNIVKDFVNAPNGGKTIAQQIKDLAKKWDLKGE